VTAANNITQVKVAFSHKLRHLIEEKYACLAQHIPLCCLVESHLEAETLGFQLLIDYTNSEIQILSLAKANILTFSTSDLIVQWRQRIKTLRNKQEPLAKAFSLSKHKIPPIIIDTTAGLGKDGICLAALGAQVVLLEQEFWLFLLLQDTILKAKQIDELKFIGQQCQLYFADAFQFDLSQATGIYCDPMFEHKKNKSAKNKKGMQVLQNVCSNSTSGELCEFLLQQLQAGQRLVMKKDIRQTAITSQLNFQITGKAIRYDIYLGI